MFAPIMIACGSFVLYILLDISRYGVSGDAI